MSILIPTRNEKLLDGIIHHKYLRTDQAAELFFKTIKNEKQRNRKASTELLKLYKAKMVQRFRFPGEPYIYTCSGTKYSPKIIHYLAISDVLLETLKMLPTGSRSEYEVELRQDNVITDLYLSWKNEFRKQSGELFIEVELENSQDVTTKIAKYEDILLDRPGSKLIIICKHKRTIDRIKAHDFDIPVQAIDIHYIRDQLQL